MTISQALKKYPQIEADLLLGHVLKQSKEFLYMNPNVKLTPKQFSNFKNIADKRKNGMPAAYLLGYKDFYGLRFKVSRKVLIPRPETEWIVDESLKIIKQKQSKNSKKELRIIDVGTGSGVIPISIATNLVTNKVKIFAIDISEKALAVAKLNAKNNHVKINFSKKDLLTGIVGKFDLIIANLPYVPISDYKKLYPGLKFEPKLAITDGTNDSVLITKLLDQAKSKLNTGGVILLEVDPSSVAKLKQIVKSKFSGRIRVVKDIHGLDRFIRIN